MPLRVSRISPVCLYFEFEEELARSQAATKDATVIVVEKCSGKPYRERRISSVRRKICEETGLPISAVAEK